MCSRSGVVVGVSATRTGVGVVSMTSFDDYVVARARHLLRVAYLLTQGAHLAEYQRDQHG